MASGDVEELADILEVISALGRQGGAPLSRLMEIADDKRRARGGFDGRVLLIRVED
jgi:predicted house-cleaning noncanonical NTP pyrophosphatase (MazG superfamily)